MKDETNPWRNPDLTAKLYNKLFAEKARKELEEHAKKIKQQKEKENEKTASA